jgi:hypothetical protein
MLASSGGLMTVLRPVVQAAVLPVLHSGHHYSLGSCVTRQFVRDHHARHDALLREQLSKQALGRCGIPTALHQEASPAAPCLVSHRTGMYGQIEGQTQTGRG